MKDWQGIIGVIGALSFLMVAVTLAVKKLSYPAEFARKTVHVGMGIICLFFPLIFETPRSVWFLAALAVTGMSLIKLSRLRNRVGTSLYSVERLSIGELLFPIGVAWVFALTIGKPLFLFTIPVLLLTIADTMSALVGTWIGKRIYKAGTCTKSVEGSCVFFLSAFILSQAGLSILSDLPILVTVLLSFTLALFSTAVEGACGYGVDNLLITIGSYFLLDYYISLPTSELLVRAGIILSILIGFLTLRKRTTLNGGSLLAAATFAFGFYSIGKLPCLLASLWIFIQHLIAVHRTKPEQRRELQLDCILGVAAPSFFWLSLHRADDIPLEVAQSMCIASFAFTAGLVQIGTEKFLKTKRLLAFTYSLLACTVAASAIWLVKMDWTLLASIILAGMITQLIFYRWRSFESSKTADWVKLGFLSLITSILIYVIFYGI